MQSNIYAAKENGDLRLVAEIEGLDDPGLAVDALLDEMPRLKQREFVVINLDNVMIVEAGDEIVQPRRQITIRNLNSGGAVVAEPEEGEIEDENGEDEPEAEEEAPAPKRRAGRPRGSTAKPAKRRPGRPRGSKNKTTGKSPFKANPKSAE